MFRSQGTSLVVDAMCGCNKQEVVVGHYFTLEKVLFLRTVLLLFTL